jgi:hypothetical protein
MKLKEIIIFGIAAILLSLFGLKYFQKHQFGHSDPSKHDPNFSDISLLLDGEGEEGSLNVTDRSKNKFQILNTGNVRIDTSKFKYGNSSLNFDGNNSLTVEHNEAFDFGTGDFTIEFWLYSEGEWCNNGGNCGVVGQKSNDQSQGWQIYRDTNFPKKLNGRIGFENNFPTNSDVGTSVWEHWALVREGTTLKWFKNGLLDNTGSSNMNVMTKDDFLSIGLSMTWKGYLKGQLDDLRITKGVARYTTNFSPPTKGLAE